MFGVDTPEQKGGEDNDVNINAYFMKFNGMNRKGLDPQVTMSKQEEKIEQKKLEQQNKVLVAS